MGLISFCLYGEHIGVGSLSDDNARIEIVCNDFAGTFLVPDDAFDLMSAGLPADERTADRLEAGKSYSESFWTAGGSHK